MKATLIIENISSLITVDLENAPAHKADIEKLEYINNGVIAVENDKIIYVGEGQLPSNIKKDENTVIISGKGKTVTPGLVDSHTHLVHGGSRQNELAMKLAGKDYLEILAEGGGIYSTVKATKSASFEELYNKAKYSLDLMLQYGVTTVEAKSGYGLDDFDTEIRQMEVAKKLNIDHPIDIVSTFMAAHAIPDKYKSDPDSFLKLIIDEMMPYVKEHNLAEYCDVFCEEGVLSIEQTRNILLKAKEYGFGIKMHADEIVSLGGAELAAELGCVSAEHLIAASEKGIKMMSEAGVIANLLPGTSFNLQKNKFAMGRFMIDNNVPVAISTDYNPGSCPSENIQLIMSIAALAIKLQAKEIITAVTLNGAAAINRQDEIGSIKVGKKADITIFNAPDLEYIIYHFGISHTDTVIKNGKVVFSKC